MGFDSTEYMVSEEDEVAVITVSVQSGTVGTTFVLNTSLSAGTATGIGMIPLVIIYDVYEWYVLLYSQMTMVL